MNKKETNVEMAIPYDQLLDSVDKCIAHLLNECNGMIDLFECRDLIALELLGLMKESDRKKILNHI